MKRSKTLKRIWSLLLTLAMVLTMGITAMPTYAAGSGTATVSYKPAAEGLVEEQTFTLYKVGHFERDQEGKSYLAFDAGLPDSVNINIKKDDYPSEDKWIEAWQEAASSYAKDLDPEKITAKYTATANQATGGVATFTGLEDGLYLVTAPMQEIMNKETGENTYITPNPSFIMVLNGTAKLEVKYEEKTIKEYVIKKAWADQGHEALRPDSIDVELYRRDSTKQYASGDEGWELVETITLSETVSEKYPTPWTYTWSSEPKFEWKWKEVMEDETAIHYIVSETSRMGQAVDDQGQAVNDDNVKYVTLTNTYTKRQLELTKILDQFLENGDNGATFVFEIRGFIGDKQVYTGSAGINFAKDATGSLTKLVDNIPVNLTRLEVEEVYAGNYRAVGAKVKDAVFNMDRGLYTVSFENEFNNDTTIKGGIVNTYTNEEGKIVLTEKDYGKTPAGGQEQ